MRPSTPSFGRVRFALRTWQAAPTASRRLLAPSASSSSSFSSFSSFSSLSTPSPPSTPSFSPPFPPARSPFHTPRHSSPCSRPQGTVQQHRRALHLPAALAPLIDAPVTAVEALLVQLHTVSHAPWFLAIPLVALGVNLLFRLPFSWHARALALKRARLAPLLQAWTVVHSKAVRRQGGASATTEDAATAAVVKRYRATARRVYRAFGVQQWKLYGNLLALPPWLVVIEALRRLCGAPVGLLGLLFRRAGGAEGADAAAHVTTEAAAQATTTTTTQAAVDGASTVMSTADPSLATGGCLWFPDLTAADPYGILPIALSAMLVINVLPGTDAGRRALFGLAPVPAAASPSSPSSPPPPAPTTVESVAARALQRTLLILSISVGFATMHFPSALHLYWLASAFTSFLITRAVRWARPIASQAVRPSRHREVPWVTPRPSASPPKRAQDGAP